MRHEPLDGDSTWPRYRAGQAGLAGAAARSIDLDRGARPGRAADHGAGRGQRPADVTRGAASRWLAPCLPLRASSMAGPDVPLTMVRLMRTRITFVSSSPTPPLRDVAQDVAAAAWRSAGPGSARCPSRTSGARSPRGDTPTTLPMIWLPPRCPAAHPDAVDTPRRRDCGRRRCRASRPTGGCRSRRPGPRGSPDR